MTAPGTDPQASPQQLSLRQVAALAEVAPAALRAWVGRDLLRASARSGRLLWFDFRAVGRARTLARFHAAGWSARRIERGLQQARRLCRGDDAALEGLLASLEVGRLAVRTADGRLLEPGGQLLMDFAGDPAAAPETGVVRSLRTPQHWFVQGVEAEASGRLEDAVRCYQRALPGGDAETSFNLGNCLFALGRREAAVAQYELAVGREADYAEAWNNLGIAQGDLGDATAAIAAFRRALELVPHYADAHYNLADALAQQDDLEGARRHFRAYLSFDPNSRWAEQVRRRLQQLEGRRRG